MSRHTDRTRRLRHRQPLTIEIQHIPRAVRPAVDRDPGEEERNNVERVVAAAGYERGMLGRTDIQCGRQQAAMADLETRAVGDDIKGVVHRR